MRRMSFLIGALSAVGALIAACGGPETDSTSTNSSNELTVGTNGEWIYQDAMASPWQDWSWATRNLANTSPVASGSRSIAVTYGAWQGLYFRRSAAVAGGNFTAFVLQVNGGSAGGAALQARAVLGNGNWTSGVSLGSKCAGGSIPANAWTTCTVPVSSLAPAGSNVVGLVVQEWAGKSLPKMYFDTIGLQGTVSAVAVSVAPSTASVATGATAQFTATVSGGTNTAVTWKVQEGSAGGTITSSGLYTAPSTAGTYHVVATSQADTTKSATATVTVTTSPPPQTVSVAISPTSASIATGQTQQFTATVTGSTNTSVTWTVQEGSAGGGISSTGLYTAPSTAGTYHAVATSQADSTKNAIATVTVSSSSSPPPSGGTYQLPADRATTWQPGVTYNGGIPSGSWPVYKTLSPSGSDDVTPIQNAIDAAHAANPNGAVVALASGTFNFNSGYVTIPSSTVLRGAGAGKTILSVTNGAKVNSETPGSHNAPIIIVGPARWSNHPPAGVVASTNLTADGAKGSRSVTVASASGFSAGQIVLLDELSGASWQTDPQGRGKVWASPDWRVVWQLHSPSQGTDDPLTATTPTGGDAAGWFCRQDRPTSEVKQIASVSGNTVTFTTPIHISYRTSHTAQLSRYEYTHVVNAGVEGLTMTGGDDGNLRFEWAARSWAKNVESKLWLNEGIAIDSSFGVEVRDSYLHDGAWSQPGGAGYALSLAVGSAEVLVENSISMMANKVMVFRCSGAGSVVGYNYVDDGFINTNGSWIEVGLNASHMVGPHHVLFEGNYGFNWDSDKTHGNSIYHTVFRNWLTGVRKSFVDPYDGATYDDASQSGDGPKRCAGAAAYSYWHSFVGNVLGRSGQMSGWVYQQTSGNDTMSNPGIWLIGWDDWSPQPSDPTVINTTIRDGNWDWVQSKQSWHNSSASTLPSSLYMPGKPAFFGSNPWPWVDPATGTTYTLPAKARFDAGTPNG